MSTIVVASTSRCPECLARPCVCRLQSTTRLMPSLRPISESCACGGPDIRAVTRLASDVSDAVLRHQVEPTHIAWQQANGITPRSLAGDDEIERDLARELEAIVTPRTGWAR